MRLNTLPPTPLSLRHEPVENRYMKWATRQRNAKAIHSTFHSLTFRYLVQERLLLTVEDLICQGLSLDSLRTPMRLEMQ